MVSKVIEQIAYISWERLRTLWHNELIKSYTVDGIKVRDAVEKHWVLREIEFANENTDFNRPKIGLLSALGYHVGSTISVKPELRRKTLSRVCVAPLATAKIM
tara:strand:+ start:1282 stop:1590 length:309 start_codon:yes stop_codon:yes gene_type:complete